jgi:hypothetical protein
MRFADPAPMPALVAGPARRDARAFAVAMVLGLHVLVAWQILSATLLRDRAVVEIFASLLAPSRRAAAPPAAPRTAPKADRRPRAGPPRSAVVAPEEAVPGVSAPAAPDVPAATPGGAPARGAPLNLALPPGFDARSAPLTPAQEARRDPRSNTLVLSPSERMSIALGQIECIAWEREPDGSIWRGPGHLQRIQDVDTNPFGGPGPSGEDRPVECVR